MVDRTADKYKSVTDWEELISLRVDQKFKKFTEDIITEHEKTRELTQEAIKTMKKTQYNKVHIMILYILSAFNIVLIAFTSGVI